MTTEELKREIEKADYNGSGNWRANYIIDKVQDIDGDAQLVFAHSADNTITTSFVAYADGTCFFVDDWQGNCPQSAKEITDYHWVTVDWRRAIVFDRLPRLFVF